MNLSFFLLLLFCFTPVLAVTPIEEEARELFFRGKYQASLDKIKQALNGAEIPLTRKGFLYYWKGLSASRLQDFGSAVESFQQALSHAYRSDDLPYELGQAYYGASLLAEAKVQFMESVRLKYKVSTSLYYIGHISRELDLREDARLAWEAVSGVADADAKETHQAAALQLSDLELEVAEEGSDVFRKIEREVIPRYEAVAKMDPASPLAAEAQKKILALQKKYNLVLFQLRNGRPTLLPPYFLRAALEGGFDTNVTFTPQETTISEARQGSAFSRAEVFARYTFYLKDFISLSPEFRTNVTHYFNRTPEIFRNDNYLVAPALRGTHEHSFFSRPAAFLFEYDFNHSERDVNGVEKFDFSSRAHVFGIGEKFRILAAGDTVIRLRRRNFESYLPKSSSTAQGMTLEQTVPLSKSMILLTAGYERIRVNDESFSTNVQTYRGDWILPELWRKLSFSPGLALAISDPINDRKKRGIETLLNPSLRVSRKLGHGLGLTLRLEHSDNRSKDDERFSYKRNLAALELEFVY